MLGAASKGYRRASSFEVFQADSNLRLGGSKCPFRALAPEKYTNTKIPRSLPFEVTQGMTNIFYRGSWPAPTKKMPSCPGRLRSEAANKKDCHARGYFVRDATGHLHYRSSHSSDKSLKYLFALSINTSFHSRFHFLSCFSLAIACFGFSNIS